MVYNKISQFAVENLHYETFYRATSILNCTMWAVPLSHILPVFIRTLAARLRKKVPKINSTQDLSKALTSIYRLH